MAKPCTPHLIAQRVQFFKPSADNGGVKGQGPLRSLGAFSYTHLVLRFSESTTKTFAYSCAAAQAF